MGDNRSLESDNWDQLRSWTLQWNDKNLPWDKCDPDRAKSPPRLVPSTFHQGKWSATGISCQCLRSWIVKSVLKAVLLPRLSIWKAHSQRLTWRCRGEKGWGGGEHGVFTLKEILAFGFSANVQFVTKKSWRGKSPHVCVIKRLKYFL